ncbi:MAG: hypothetical protein AB1467_07135 [Candidatus Diapherotrites archaeon]
MAYLALVDIPGIKEYVFGTDRLVQIRGASAFLDRWNRFNMRQFLEESPGVDQVEAVFAGGGAGEFILQAREGEATAALNNLADRLRIDSQGGLSLVFGLAPYQEGGYKSARDQAFQELRARKENPRLWGEPLIHTGYIRECDTCSGMAAVIQEYGGESWLLCDTCKEKLAWGRDRGHFLEYGRFQGWDDDQTRTWRPRDFEEIGLRSRTGHTALVYADGNTMGRIIKEIKEKEHFHLFSQTVEACLKKACHEALKKHCEPRPYSSGGEEPESKVPADILLLGGDDLVVYLAAETALPFALDAAKWFMDLTQVELAKDQFFKDLLQGGGLTFSLGIAIGKSHTPVVLMLEQAQELLRSAKEKGATDSKGGPYYSPAYMDYHFTSYFNQVRVKDCRDTHLLRLEAKPLRLTAKPYSLEDAQAIWDQARKLAEADFPRSRLYALGTAPTKGKINATLECLTIWGRTKAKEHRQLVGEALNLCGDPIMFPWREDHLGFNTGLLDLMEMVELVVLSPPTGEG